MAAELNELNELMYCVQIDPKGPSHIYIYIYIYIYEGSDYFLRVCTNGLLFSETSNSSVHQKKVLVRSGG